MNTYGPQSSYNNINTDILNTSEQETLKEHSDGMDVSDTVASTNRLTTYEQATMKTYNQDMTIRTEHRAEFLIFCRNYRQMGICSCGPSGPKSRGEGV